MRSLKLHHAPLTLCDPPCCPVSRRGHLTQATAHLAPSSRALQLHPPAASQPPLSTITPSTPSPPLPPTPPPASHPIDQVLPRPLHQVHSEVLGAAAMDPPGPRALCKVPSILLAADPVHPEAAAARLPPLGLGHSRLLCPRMDLDPPAPRRRGLRGARCNATGDAASVGLGIRSGKRGRANRPACSLPEPWPRPSLARIIPSLLAAEDKRRDILTHRGVHTR